MTREYANEPMDEASLPAVPFVLFEDWYGAAAKTEPWKGSAMVLSTVGLEGGPTSRVVLLRGVDADGFCFFTNYQSRKGRDLAETPGCSLVFWWPSQVRQVRVEGVANKLPVSISDAYFAARSLESRIGAWASPQSQPIRNRRELEDSVAEMTESFDGNDVPRPPQWGGFLVVPHRFEFWQGGRARLHDRFCYAREHAGSPAWTLTRLAP